MRYAVVYEKSGRGWGAYVPDLPGCVALGFSLDETKQLIQEPLEVHLLSLREDGEAIPQPSQFVELPRSSLDFAPGLPGSAMFSRALPVQRFGVQDEFTLLRPVARAQDGDLDGRRLPG